MNGHESRRATPGGSGHPDRREFGRMALAGTLGAAALLEAARPSKAAAPGEPSAIKLCAQSSARPTAEELLFLEQIGARYASVPAPADLRTADGFKEIVKRHADAGITVWNIGNTDVHNMPEVTLNLPGPRPEDRAVQGVSPQPRGGGHSLHHLRAHGQRHLVERPGLRAGSLRPGIRPGEPDKRGTWGGKSWREPLSHGRVFTPDEIWENYSYFIRQVAPVAEEVGVRIGIHPDDPPVPVLAGVPRCIFGNFEGYKRDLEIAGSPNVGICLCCGTWLEGGRLLTGKDPEEMIRTFGADKIWKIHFRNVSAPLPHFVETFMDNGYYDMYKIMKALHDVKFKGIVILDHSPRMVGGNYVQTAYGFATMRRC